MIKHSKTRLGLFALLFVLLVCVIGIAAFFYLRSSKPENLFYPEVKGQVIDRNGKPVSRAYILVVWSGDELRGSWWFPFDQEMREQPRYREAYIETDSSGKFTIGSWVKSKRLSGIMDWSGDIGLFVVATGYRPALFSSSSIPMFITEEHINNKEKKSDSLKASRDKQPLATNMSIKLESLTSDEDAIKSLIQLDDNQVLDTASAQTRSMSRSANLEYFRQVLKLYPRGPESPAIIAIMKAKQGYMYTVPLSYMCQDVINTSKDPTEIAVAEYWHAMLKGFREEGG